MTINYKKIISTLLVCVLAILTGVSIGKLYLDANTAPADSTKSYAEVHMSEAEMKKLYDRSLLEPVDNFDAVELFAIAEYKLNLQDFRIETSGIIDSGSLGISAKVDFKGIKTKIGNSIDYKKFSPPSPIPGGKSPNVCYNFKYEIGKSGVEVLEGEFVSGDDKFNARFPSNGKVWDDESYIARFKTTPDKAYLPYIISNQTVSEPPEVVYDEDSETYSFTFVLSGHSVVSDAALCYTREITYTCGYSGAGRNEASVSWTNVSIKVTLDKNLQFKYVNYNENYKLYTPYLPMNVGQADVNDLFNSEFFYGDEVTA